MRRIVNLTITFMAWLTVVCPATEAAPSRDLFAPAGSWAILAAAQKTASEAPGLASEKTPSAGGNETEATSPGAAASVQKAGSGESGKPSGAAEGQSVGKAKTGPVIKYENESQRAKCESHRQNLKDKFLKARYFSIQGDPCATAEHARAFLDLVETCSRECPKDFVKEAGYSDRTLRNVKLLHKHGSERCLK